MTKSKLTKIIVWSVVGVLLLLILIPLCSMLIQKYIQKKDVPMFMGYAWLIVLTPSMTGYADQGDLIIIKKADEYFFNDVITYVEKKGELPVTHRVVEVDKEAGTYTTKGDTNKDYDDPVSADKVYGKVVAVIPHVGLFFEWFTNDGGIIYAIALIAVIVAGVFMWNWISDPKKAADGADASKADADKSDDKSNADESIKSDGTDDTQGQAQDNVQDDNQQSQK